MDVVQVAVSGELPETLLALQPVLELHATEPLRSRGRLVVLRPFTAPVSEVTVAVKVIDEP
jgi:hypothetical protein